MASRPSARELNKTQDSSADGSAGSLIAHPALWALIALNFFMADVQAGIGPFLGIFLQAHGWRAGLIGTVMTIGGIAGMLMTVPAGAAIDASKRKRLFIIVPGIFTILASAVILLSQNFWVVAASQVATSLAGATLGPAISGITLGLVFQRGFNRQMGFNQASNHAGNVAGAALSGFLGWKFGYPAVFYLAAAFGVFSIISILMIPPSAINDRAARGCHEHDDDAETSGFSVLWKCRPLLILALSLACFHLGNAAMLPLYGLAVVKKIGGTGTGFVAMTIIVAQAVMIVTSLIAMKVAEKRGYWLVILISFLSLPLRGLLAAYLIHRWGVYPVQFLDGIGAGLQSVAVPGLVARLMRGTGRVNVAQGAVMTAQGFGGAFSPIIGGWLAELYSYPVAFMVLGGFAIASVGLWFVYARTLQPACDDTPEKSRPAMNLEPSPAH